MFNHTINRISGLTSLFVFALFWTSAVHSAPGNIANSPLFANSNVAPNIFFEMDDSGSMDWEVLTKPHWTACTYDRNFHADTSNNACAYGFNQFRADGLIVNTTVGNPRQHVYIFSNADGAYSDQCSSALELCTTAERQFDWRVFSSDLNVLYYNPSSNYLPWQGTGLSNGTFSAALSDPQPGTAGVLLSKDLAGFVYEVWLDGHGFGGAQPIRGPNLTNNRTNVSNTEVDWWDDHVRFTVNANDIQVRQITYDNNGDEIVALPVTLAKNGTVYPVLGNKTVAEVQQNIANWYQYYRRRSFVAKAALGSVVTSNPDFRYGLSVINNPGTLFTEVPATNVTDYTTHNTDLLDDFFDFNWPNSGTPLRSGLENAGEYFSGNLSGKTNPILYECQQNFTVLFTDGFWNGNPPTTVTSDVDGDGIDDGSGDDVTLADVARYYYVNDLDTNLANEVPKNSFDAAAYQHMVTMGIAFGVRGALPDVDNNGWPEDASDPSINRPVSSSWGNPFNGSPQKIDDLWHASFNSRGTFISASTPGEVSESLNRAIGNVGNRLGSAASVAFSTTSLSSDTDVFLAQFNKQGNKWSGDLFSLELDDDGIFVTQVDPDDSNTPPRKIIIPTWSAAEALDNRANPASSRAIITYDKTLNISGNVGNGVPFLWNNLTTAQKNDFRTEPNGTLTADDVKAEARLDFLRGDRTNETLAQGTYAFRDRAGLLGDIINSSPAFVKLPSNNWPGNSPFPSSTGNTYTDFLLSQSSRNGVIYVGANDGMLHAFSETTGEEILAYVPSFLFSSASANEGLHFLSDPEYQHRFYVDLGPTVSDVYIDTADGRGKEWHSVLIGGTRSGGRGMYALDVTDPTKYTEANAAKIALWEFSDADDADLGLTFSQPTIAMMSNKRWAAIFGNGYNNKGDGKAKLFIVFLDGGIDGVWTPGTDYIEIDTGVGSIVGSDCLNASSSCNGLSTPQAVDLNNDQKIDRVYAGDVQGNLWAFDVSNEIDTTKWSSAYKQGNTPKPLFIASSSQPITVKPTVSRHPEIKTSGSNEPNLLVYFGTGQYLTDSDVTTVPATQSFYGIWDHGTKEITPNDLFEQRFDTTSTFFDTQGCDLGEINCGAGKDLTDTVRVFKDYDADGDGDIDDDDTINYDDSSKTLHDGWKINFNVAGIPGERVIADPVLHAGLVFFNTVVPDSSPCHAGGIGYLMSVEQVNGGTPDLSDPAFDLNRDGFIDSSDLVQNTNSQKAPVGEKFGYGLAASSKVISHSKKSRQLTPGSDRGGDGGGGGGDGGGGNAGTDNRVIRGRRPGDPEGPGGPGSPPIGRFSWQELR